MGKTIGKKDIPFIEQLKKKSIYVADFETRTSAWNEEKTEVWLSYVQHLFNEEDNNLNISIQRFFSDFVDTLKKPSTIYFHNLNFDGEFILNYLCDISNYKKPNPNRKYKTKLEKNQFTNMSDGVSSHYEIVYTNLQGVHIRFKDSYKLLVSSVSSLQGVEEKDKIDYNWMGDYKDVSEVSEEHKNYIFSDVRTVIEKLRHFLIRLEKSSSLTAAGSARKNMKEFVGVEKFDLYFKNKIKPGEIKEGVHIKGEWDYYRNFYVGGYCLNNPNFLGKLVETKENESIKVLDFNSLYPSIMRFEELPYGFPFPDCECKGTNHNGQLLEILLSAKIKKGRIPFIPENANQINIKWLTNVENKICYFTEEYWKEVQKGYDILSFKILKSTCFNKKRGIFDDFIDYWNRNKVEAKMTGDKAEYLLDKTMPNSSYGKFAMDYLRKQMFLRKIEEGEKIRKGSTTYGSNGEFIWDFEFTLSEPEYIPMALYITSLAKLWTIRVIEIIQKFGGVFLYSDTDSVHFKISNENWEKLKIHLDIDSTKLGALDLEGEYNYHMCWGRKRYIEFDNLYSRKRNKGFAGVSMSSIQKYFNLQFVKGRVIFKKNIKTKVQGGIIIKEKEVKIENYDYKKNNL